MYLVQSYQDMLHSTTMASIMVILVTDAIVAPTLQVRTPASPPMHRTAPLLFGEEKGPKRFTHTHHATQQVLNLPQRLMQRFAAPKAPTQSAMNAYFSGLPWHLAERYTELSKVGGRRCVFTYMGLCVASLYACVVPSVSYSDTPIFYAHHIAEHRPCSSRSFGLRCYPVASSSPRPPS